jgi:hypothetical protein
MNITTPEQIVISASRLRREFDKLYIVSLGESIKDKGLMHPIVLHNDGKTLCAGEQRLMAMIELHRQGKTFTCNGVTVPRDGIPYTILKALTPLQQLEAEYEENCVRRDLSWQERSAAIASLHRLRAAQRAATGGVQTLVATASEIAGHAVAGRPITVVSDALLLDRFKTDPEVMKAASAKEAVNIAKKKITAQNMRLAAETFKSANVKAPHTALLGSCLEVDPAALGGPFDVICTDPPYGINAHKMAPLSGSQAGTEHAYDDTHLGAEEVWRWIFGAYRYCKPQAALYMFYDFRHDVQIRRMANLDGWTVWPTPIIWHKPSGGMIGDSAHGPRKSYECILFAYRGDKRTTGTYLDVIIDVGGDSSLHAANKPISVIRDLLRRSCTPGMAVLDPCMGSGTIFPACNQLALKATGIELDQAHFGTAVSRINDKE